MLKGGKIFQKIVRNVEWEDGRNLEKKRKDGGIISKNLEIPEHTAEPRDSGRKVPVAQGGIIL
jgi:hypothetical protein